MTIGTIQVIILLLVRWRKLTTPELEGLSIGSTVNRDRTIWSYQPDGWFNDLWYVRVCLYVMPVPKMKNDEEGIRKFNDLVHTAVPSACTKRMLRVTKLDWATRQVVP
jgi:hypothetical protein